jgi:hypothetical protein
MINVSKLKLFVIRDGSGFGKYFGRKIQIIQWIMCIRQAIKASALYIPN